MLYTYYFLWNWSITGQFPESENPEVRNLKYHFPESRTPACQKTKYQNVKKQNLEFRKLERQKVEKTSNLRFCLSIFRYSVFWEVYMEYIICVIYIMFCKSTFKYWCFGLVGGCGRLKQAKKKIFGKTIDMEKKRFLR